MKRCSFDDGMLIIEKNSVKILDQDKSNLDEIFYQQFDSISVSCEVEKSDRHRDYDLTVSVDLSLVRGGKFESVVSSSSFSSISEFIKSCSLVIDSFNEYKIAKMQEEILLRSSIHTEAEAKEICTNLFFKTNNSKEEILNEIDFFFEDCCMNA